MQTKKLSKNLPADCDCSQTEQSSPAPELVLLQKKSEADVWNAQILPHVTLTPVEDGKPIICRKPTPSHGPAIVILQKDGDGWIPTSMSTPEKTIPAMSETFKDSDLSENNNFISHTKSSTMPIEQISNETLNIEDEKIIIDVDSTPPIEYKIANNNFKLSDNNVGDIIELTQLTMPDNKAKTSKNSAKNNTGTRGGCGAEKTNDDGEMIPKPPKRQYRKRKGMLKDDEEEFTKKNCAQKLFPDDEAEDIVNSKPTLEYAIWNRFFGERNVKGPQVIAQKFNMRTGWTNIDEEKAKPNTLLDNIEENLNYLMELDTTPNLNTDIVFSSHADTLRYLEIVEDLLAIPD